MASIEKLIWRAWRMNTKEMTGLNESYMQLKEMLGFYISELIL